MGESDRARVVRSLHASPRALWYAYDLAMLDLDGVVYRGTEPVQHAAQRLTRLREKGVRPAFVTNNAARTPAVVAAQLRGLGVDCSDSDVVTSGQAAARMMAALVPVDGRVLVVGGEGLREALSEHGLAAVPTAADHPDGVVQGFAPEVGWALLAEGAYAVAAGRPWVASNLDATIPTASGFAPGNGTLVSAIATATGRRPMVAGKPEPALFHETVLRVGGDRPLVVGDRLDTDIAGANRVGADSLLVLTGVTDLDSLAAAVPAERPTFASQDLSGLEVVHATVELEGRSATCGSWSAQVVSGALELTRRSLTTSGQAREGTDLLRAVVTAAWRCQDAGAGTPAMSAVAAQLQEMMTPEAEPGRDEDA